MLFLLRPCLRKWEQGLLAEARGSEGRGRETKRKKGDKGWAGLSLTSLGLCLCQAAGYEKSLVSKLGYRNIFGFGFWFFFFLNNSCAHYSLCVHGSFVFIHFLTPEACCSLGYCRLEKLVVIHLLHHPYTNPLHCTNTNPLYKPFIPCKSFQRNLLNRLICKYRWSRCCDIKWSRQSLRPLLGGSPGTC